MINYCIQNDKVQWDYVKAFTNAAYIVKDGFAYQDGLFTGYDETKRDYDKSTWDYEIGEDGFAVVDETLQNPRCVWNLLEEARLRLHAGDGRAHLRHAQGQVPEDGRDDRGMLVADKAMTSMYALGWTQHSKGSQNIRAMAMLQLILGNIGVRGGGMNALRGHSNIQGLTDVGLMSNLLPGYLTLPTEKEPRLRQPTCRRAASSRCGRTR